MEIDITKVDISARGLGKLILAVVILAAIIGVGLWIYNKAKGVATPAISKAKEVF